jgi:acetyl-CoA carboxylase / biotin carboxylase 1
MAALGDKISANILAQSAKVPSIPWSGDHITLDVKKRQAEAKGEDIIPKELFAEACITTADEAKKVADKIGYPVMIKASEGGGGKGIRLANNVEELKTNFIQVQNEVPGSPIFMMKLCTQARHIEVQIVGDEHGNAIALNGRDCSTQRRFQKIFEEGPPSIVPKETFHEMELAAQRLTQSIGYVGAGTVEYLYNKATNSFFFLELNPRLQVEHPVTEGITDINLPALQLQVAMGIPLSNVPAVRKFYGRNVNEKTPIDFFEDRYVYPDRHVIAARITAENPEEGFKPSSGKIERVKFQSTKNVWGYFSVGANGGIHEFADSQFGHLFATGQTREEARRALVLALKGMDVRGDIRTTVEYLIKLLETQEFKDNDIDTSWLDGIIRKKSVTTTISPQIAVLSAAVFRSFSSSNTQVKDLTEALSKGQTSLQTIPSILQSNVEITYDDTKYVFSSTMLGPNYYAIKINGQTIEVRIREQPDKSLLCTIGGESYQLFGQEEALGLRMKINGATVFIPTVYNPSELRSDVTGKIVRFLQQDGEEVSKDQAYVEVEAMKMIMAIKSTESGTVTHNLSPGSVIQAGDLIASLKLKDPSKVKQIVSFKERLNVVAPVTSMTPEEAVEKISLSVDGYDHDFESALNIVLTMRDLFPLLDVLTMIQTQLKKFLDTEVIYSSNSDETVVISNLIKLNKDKLSTLVPQLIAHKQLKQRSRVILTLLRQLESLPQRFTDYRTNRMPAELKEILKGLASLSGASYGEVSLKSKQLLDESEIPPFDTRLNLLRKRVLTVAEGNGLASLALEPNIAVSVDLLVVLISDPDPLVRKAAAEVYLRRVYRAHVIKSLDIDAGSDGVLSATWSFVIRDVDPNDAPVRHGYMTFVQKSAGEISSSLPAIINQASKYFSGDKISSTSREPLNVLHIGFPDSGNMDSNTCASTIEKSLTAFKVDLTRMNIRMANFFIINDKRVDYFNYYSDINFLEDPICRNMRPTMPQLLELNRLTKNFDLERIPAVGRNAYMFLGREKTVGAAKKKSDSGAEVVFLRSITLSADVDSAVGAERLVTMAIDELERAFLDPRVGDSVSSRVFVNVLTSVKRTVDSTVRDFKYIMDVLISKYATKLLKLRVDEIEVKLRIVGDGQDTPVPVRLIASSSAGGWLTREAYRETLDPITGQTINYCTMTGKNDICILDPYPTSSILQTKRTTARKVGSTYAYDFLGLLEVALINSWQSYLEGVGSTQPIPPLLFTADELVLDKNTGALIREKRFPGTNKIGMLAWVATMKTPQYPAGREVVFIANDVTVQSGSFGVLEDEFFYKASEYARQHGLPRIFLSCNSGARIGLVEDLKPKFQVAWKDPNNPFLGFEYLYLTEDDYKSLPAGTVSAERKVTVSGEVHYMLDAIIGLANGIGVENLRGSGLIAGETSRAYDEIFTLSYVTGRSVGIGAYLNRLGQRVIQMQQGPMILTGYSALNKLLGREVYTSQDQLGGPQIMYNNGVSHEVVSNDKEGMQAVVDWLSYVPKTFSSPTAMIRSNDPVTRDIDFMPTKSAYDPRHMLAGTIAPDGSFISGFFDKNSFKEYLGGWGKSVIVGRARLGGINVGVIAVETRTVEQRIPADPGNPESRETIQLQAGNVWYPDSAFKTAQAINDFNRGENLPLIIFANWRGFSGGTRDMYNEILKFGAMIVDGLRNYQHPVFVYIPPAGELRGGAWVVIDPTINPKKMEMYADKNSRGGILEPPGICEVKYRSQEQKATMHRIDPTLVELDEMLGHLDSPSESQIASMNQEIKTREKALAPVYLQIAHEFADLHDRAGRMKAKGCISEVLDWKRAREFFYWRILRRLGEDEVKSTLESIYEDATIAQIDEQFVKMLPEEMKSMKNDFSLEANKKVAEWLTANKASTSEKLHQLGREVLKAKVAKLAGVSQPATH